MLTKKVSQQYIAKAKIPFIGITMEGKKIKPLIPQHFDLTLFISS